MELTFPDREDREYVQRVFGYALQGTQKERAFFLFYGDGHNGKSIMLRVLEKVLGLGGHGYAQQLATATFSRSTATEINSGLAKLRGIRFASIGEFPNKSLNSELIKAMTGGESNTARQLYAKTAEFPYQCHLFFTSNNTPGPTDGTDEAFWDRMLTRFPAQPSFHFQGSLATSLRT